MQRRIDIHQFATSRTGRSYFKFLLFCALFSFGIGLVFYETSLRSYTVSKLRSRLRR